MAVRSNMPVSSHKGMKRRAGLRRLRTSSYVSVIPMRFCSDVGG
jgi:hypothetical protein